MSPAANTGSSDILLLYSAYIDLIGVQMGSQRVHSVTEGINVLSEGNVDITKLVCHVKASEVSKQQQLQLAAALASNQAVRSLDVTESGNCSTFLVAALEGIRYNTFLTSLSIDSRIRCRDGEDISMALVAVIKSNKTLESLSLHFEFIDNEERFVAIAAAIAESKYLQCVRFTPSIMSTERTSLAMCQMVEQNSKLHTVHLHVRDQHIHKRVPAAEAAALGKALHLNNALKHFTFWAINGQCDSFCQEVCPAIARKNGMETFNIDIASSTLPLPVAASLAKMIQEHRTLLHFKVRAKFDEESGMLLAKGLERNESIVSLEITSSTLEDQAAAALSVAVQQMRSLKSLTFFLEDNRSVGDATAEAWANAIEEHNTLESFDIVGAETIGEQGWVAILRAIIALQQCRICADGCDIGDSVHQAAADVIQRSTSLISFTYNASSGPTGSDIGIAMADAIRQNITLKILKLSGEFGEEGGKAMAFALGRNSTLEVFSLEAGFTSVSDGTFIALGEAMKKNTTLRSLKIDVPGIQLGREAALAFCKAIKQNWTLHFFTWDLEEADIEDEDDVVTSLQNVDRLMLRNRLVHCERQRLLQLATLCESMTLASLKERTLREMVFQFLCPMDFKLSLFKL